MRVGIYCEFNEGNTIGGREFIVAVMCEWFAKRGDLVELVHHSQSLTSQAFAVRFGLDPEGIHLRRVPPRSAGQLWRGRRAWEGLVSASYDLFISIVHDVPVFCHSRRGMLMVLFPFVRPFALLADRRMHGRGMGRVRYTLRQWVYRRGWHRQLHSYQALTSISEFARKWTESRWRVQTQVLYPPVAPDLELVNDVSGKTTSILSVGRFSVEGVPKRQLEMMDVFRKMVLAGETDWRFACVGGVTPAEEGLFEKVKDLGEGVGGEVIANIPRAQLRTLYSDAKIFWHAAGLGENASTHPELSEHYGIATVEAMTAGCVPVVINQGAQPEIVEHGVSGFVWNSLDELRTYTLRLIRNDALRAQMAVAARDRASRCFTKQRFEQNLASIVESLLGENGLGKTASIDA